MSCDASASGGTSASTRKLGPVEVMLLTIPCVAVLVVPWFNRVDPTFAGIPFFYWWQMLWAPLSSVFMATVYAMSRRGTGKA